MARSKKTARYTVADYFAEPVCYGGLMTTRGEMIADLQRSAASITSDPKRQQRLVNAYLMGHERGSR